RRPCSPVGRRPLVPARSRVGARALAAFPTRRSSDLPYVVPAQRARAALAPDAQPLPHLGVGGHAPTDAGGPRHPLLRAVHLAVSDRKSTRLNSSHVKTSYAVFCLKKNTDESSGLSRR